MKCGFTIREDVSGTGAARSPQAALLLVFGPVFVQCFISRGHRWPETQPVTHTCVAFRNHQLIYGTGLVTGVGLFYCLNGCIPRLFAWFSELTCIFGLTCVQLSPRSPHPFRERIALLYCTNSVFRPARCGLLFVCCLNPPSERFWFSCCSCLLCEFCCANFIKPRWFKYVLLCCFISGFSPPTRTEVKYFKYVHLQLGRAKTTNGRTINNCCRLGISRPKNIIRSLLLMLKFNRCWF